MAWWSRSNPADYARYVQRYGEPDHVAGLATGDYEGLILEARQSPPPPLAP